MIFKMIAKLLIQYNCPSNIIPILHTEIFKNEIDNDKDIAFTCGSGVTACILGLANSIISGKKPTIYDGSWSEYGLEKK